MLKMFLKPATVQTHSDRNVSGLPDIVSDPYEERANLVQRVFGDRAQVVDKVWKIFTEICVCLQEKYTKLENCVCKTQVMPPCPKPVLTPCPNQYWRLMSEMSKSKLQ